MTTNTPIIFVHDDGRMSFGRYVKTFDSGFIHIRYEDFGDTYNTSVSPDNAFPRTNDGLNLAFERAAHLRLREAIENNETDLLPTEVAYIATAVQTKAA